MTTPDPSATLQVPANELVHRVLEWAPWAPPSAAPGFAAPAVILLHGYMDAAGTWDRVAPALAAEGLRVLAPDMRGFGHGARAPHGSYYHFVDYVFDLADLALELSPRAPVAIVGHSMGGTIATLFAGTFPERVARLALVEGVGPPDNAFALGPVRMRGWIDQVRKARAGGMRAPTLSRDEALRRLAANHPGVPREVLEHRLPHLVEPARDGRVSWSFDPLHRTTSPTPFFAKLFVEFARRVTCPVLFVSGGPRGYHPPDEEERLAVFSTLERYELASAGHMVHWTEPDALALRLLEHLRAR